MIKQRYYKRALCNLSYTNLTEPFNTLNYRKGIFREKAYLIKQRYYERALCKWKNTTNFAFGYSIPAVAVAKAPRLWQDPRTKKYFGGEDPMEWADNNHPVSKGLG